MPITIAELEERGEDVVEKKKESRAPLVLAFLKENSNEAYTQTEIGKEVGVQGPHAHSILTGLVKKGVIERKQAPGMNARGQEQSLIYYRYVGEEAAEE